MFLDDANVAAALFALSRSVSASQTFLESFAPRTYPFAPRGLVGYGLWGPSGAGEFAHVIRVAARGTGPAYTQAAESLYSQAAAAFDADLASVMVQDGVGQALADVVTFPSNMNGLTDQAFEECSNPSQESPTVMAKALAVVLQAKATELDNAWAGPQSGLTSLLARLEGPIGIPPIANGEVPQPPPLTLQALSGFGQSVGVFRGLYMAALFEEANHQLAVTDTELQNGLLIFGFATGPMGLLKATVAQIVAGAVPPLAKLLGYEGIAGGYELATNYAATAVPIMDRAMVTYLMAVHREMFYTPMLAGQIQTIAANPTGKPPVYDPNPATNSPNTSDIQYGKLPSGDTYDAGISAAVTNLQAWALQTFVNVEGGRC